MTPTPCFFAVVIRNICTLLGGVSTTKDGLTRFGLDYGMRRPLVLNRDYGNLHSWLALMNLRHFRQYLY
ncbi:MAG: hypothetical protein CBD74_03690 [Saprospirales bacterium TMED214]|nr:MAG: hypothetical protein CBD74_03690 [Saprospirales bacterium TMED214]